MKRLISTICATVFGMALLFAQGKAEITFNETRHDFGVFSENEPIVTHVFKFKNTGDEALIIHQAIASCGCTVPKYTKTPIKPGETGEISVTYNGAGRFPGKFRKTITVHSNAENKTVRLYIAGEMTPKDLDLQKAMEETTKQMENANK